MRTVSSAVLFSFLSLAVACGSPQKPATFVTSAKMESGLDVVSRTLASEGHGTPQLDRQAGIAHGEWKDSGFLFGQVGQAPATIVRRFTVVFAPSGDGSNVTVRIDAKRCVQGTFSVENNEVRGTCEELDQIPERFQEEIDALANKLHGVLASAH